MYEADLLSDRIAIINHGKIIALDTPFALKRTVQDLSVIEIELYGAPQKIVETIKAISGIDSVSLQERDIKQLLTIQTSRGSLAVTEIISALSGYKTGRVDLREPTLEDAYIRLVGNENG
jgi:ABC-2 type transport system ATP-binding protein